jgi:hypothetical protein
MYLRDSLVQPVIFGIADCLNVHGGHHNHRVSNVGRTSLEDTDMDVGLFSKSRSNDKSSRASAYNDEVVLMLEELLNGAKRRQVLCFCHHDD